jgi:proteic killer suppression protein
MDIGFRGSLMQRLGNDGNFRRKRLGEERAKKLLLRLNQITAASSLEELCSLPQARCHQLSGNRKDQFSVDLDGPYRLIVEVSDDPIPRRTDGGIDRSQVHGLVALEITDTH